MNTLTLEKHCWAEIDLTALRENYEYIRRTVGGPVCAVVKADAYGHGDTSSPAFCRRPVLRASQSVPLARGGTCAAAASQRPS